jgi:MFS family permease
MRPTIAGAPVTTAYTPLTGAGSNRLPVLMAILVGQGAVAFGYHMGFSSPTSTFIKTRLGLSDFQRDLGFAVVCLGAVLGSFLAGNLADKYGRRRALLLTPPVFLVGTLCLVYNLTYWGFCLGRILVGVAVGECSVLVPLYITETSPAHLRGTLGTVNQLMITVGVLIINALGLLSEDTEQWWQLLLFISLFPAAGLFLAAWYGPETPRWLLSNNRRTDAYQALSRLRGMEGESIDDELNDILGVSINGTWAGVCCLSLHFARSTCHWLSSVVVFYTHTHTHARQMVVIFCLFSVCDFAVISSSHGPSSQSQRWVPGTVCTWRLGAIADGHGVATDAAMEWRQCNSVQSLAFGVERGRCRFFGGASGRHVHCVADHGSGWSTDMVGHLCIWHVFEVR